MRRTIPSFTFESMFTFIPLAKSSSNPTARRINVVGPPTTRAIRAFHPPPKTKAKVSTADNPAKKKRNLAAVFNYAFPI